MAARKQETYMSDDERLAIVETTLSNINTTLSDIKQDMKRQFDKIDAKFERIDAKFDAKFDAFEKKMDDKFNILINRNWSSFLWLMSMMIGLAGLIAHAQHWI